MMEQGTNEPIDPVKEALTRFIDQAEHLARDLPFAAMGPAEGMRLRRFLTGQPIQPIFSLIRILSIEKDLIPMPLG